MSHDLRPTDPDALSVRQQSVGAESGSEVGPSTALCRLPPAASVTPVIQYRRVRRQHGGVSLSNGFSMRQHSVYWKLDDLSSTSQDFQLGLGRAEAACWKGSQLLHNQGKFNIQVLRYLGTVQDAAWLLVCMAAATLHFCNSQAAMVTFSCTDSIVRLVADAAKFAVADLPCLVVS